MADSLRKVDRRDGLAENDPLYELTRIMGLQTVQPANAYDEFDLETDLENELAGGWVEPAGPARRPYEAPVVTHRPPAATYREPVVENLAQSEPYHAPVEAYRAPVVQVQRLAETTPRRAEADPLADFMTSMESELAGAFAMAAPPPRSLASAPDREAAAARFDPEIDFSEWDEAPEEEPAAEPLVSPAAAAVLAAFARPQPAARAVVEEPAPEIAAPEAEAEPEAAWEEDALDFEDLDFDLTDDRPFDSTVYAEAPGAEAIAAEPAYEHALEIEDLQFDAADDERAAEPVESYDYDAALADGAEWLADGAEVQEADQAAVASAAAHLPPEIDTVEVPNGHVALADDFGIPELTVEEEPATVQDFDDLEAEFATAFNELRDPEPSQDQWQPTGDVAAPGEDWQAWDASADAAPLEEAGASQHPANPGDTFSIADFEDEIERSVAAELAQQRAYDEELDRDIALPSYETGAQAARPPLRRGMVVAALVASVAIAGAAGAYVMAGHSRGSSGPVLVKADPQPMKVKPTNPGGTAVANQDNKVYDRVAGDAVDVPAQQKLVTTEEEPLDIKPAPAPEPVQAAPAAPAQTLADDDTPAMATGAKAIAAATPAQAKSEERVTSEDTGDQLTAAAPANAVAPRRVHTMVVRPDGTLAPREDPAPSTVSPDTTAGTVAVSRPGTIDTTAGNSSAELKPLDTASGDQAMPSAEGPGASDTASTAATTPSAPEPASAAKPDSADAETDTDTATAEPPAKPAPAPVRKVRQQTTPDVGPIAPSRPADQPVDIVGQVKPSEVASAATAAAPSSADQPAVSTVGRWAMQIASQPSEQAAQSSYQDLLRRYGSVLSGKPAGIVKADVAGKGTVWRVRVAAESKSEAQALCIQYKAAGGNCFVSK